MYISHGFIPICRPNHHCNLFRALLLDGFPIFKLEMDEDYELLLRKSVVYALI